MAKLTEDRLRAIAEALRLGLSEREAAELAGISDRTLYNWKARARAVADVLPEDWPRLKYEELLACAQELDIDLGHVNRTGRGNRLTREDLCRVLRDRTELYASLLRQLEAAGPASKLALLQILDDLNNGRVKMKRTRTTQHLEIVHLDDGATLEQPVGQAVRVTEELELPKDRQAVIKTLEMRWPETYGRRNGKGGDPQAPGAAAKEVNDAVHRMLSTVPPPAGLLPENVPEDSENS